MTGPNVPEAVAESQTAETKTGADAPPLQLRGVDRIYERGGETVRALQDVDLTVRAGEFVAVVGPSGSGKSTMLNTLGLLDTPTSGDVFLDGDEVSDLDDEARTRLRKEYIGFIFQDFYLLPTLTALENVLLPTVYDADREATDRGRGLLQRVGLGDRITHRPTELSGGQKQRVAIARSLINSPEVLLADEPTGNLDTDTGRQVLGEFERVCEEGVAVVAVTHDELVTEYADRTVELVDGRLEDRR
ncbi:ABC transporter ATP-binding protein [Natronomonas amylolytica]|uniref:ABC transporter ATP-binding protein n=1 Tax=Natronomonas amylolytica TaxID=3108498 RepID=UPI00300B873D